MLQQITPENITISTPDKRISFPVVEVIEKEASRGPLYRVIAKIARAVQSIFAPFIRLFKDPVVITIGEKTPIKNGQVLKGRLTIAARNLPRDRKIEAVVIYGDNLLVELDPGFDDLCARKIIFINGGIPKGEAALPELGNYMEERGWTFMTDEECQIGPNTSGTWTLDLAMQSPVPRSIYHL